MSANNPNRQLVSALLMALALAEENFPPMNHSIMKVNAHLSAEDQHLTFLITKKITNSGIA
jgi:diacylglycerol kinase family enzyme